MKKTLSLLAVALLCIFTTRGTTSLATQQNIRFIFTSFGQVERVVLENVQTAAVIELDADQLFDYESFDFVDEDTKEIRVTKFYMDGEIVEQVFEVDDAKETVGIYDDGVQGESWLELDGEYIF